MQPAQIIEMDEERDRKTCVALDLKVTGANHELAQWLLDHPRYSNVKVAAWLGHGEAWVRRLRHWAQRGFTGRPNDGTSGKKSSSSTSSELKSLDNSDLDRGGDDIADSGTIEDNALHTLARMSEHARVFRKFFRLSSFDRETERRIITAIDRMIEKWRSAQSTLTKRKRDDA